MSGISFMLNGKETVFSGSAAEILLDILRNEYGLTSVKCGCREGECGACAVLIDGLLRNSCCVLMGAVNGSEIVTLEGYRETEQFRVLESAFGAFSAVQCGFCIPGMILASQALLSQNPHPTEDEIRTGLSGNLCRCTGYNAIVKAVKKASEEGNGLW